MTTTVEFVPNDRPGAKAHVEALHKALAAVLAGGFVDHLTINGVPEILASANTPEGSSTFHPTDEKRDSHMPHPPGHRHPGSYSYTLVPKP